MSASKIDIDKLIQYNLKKINSEKDRNLQGYRFAKMYFKCGEYESARRYVSSYLTVTPDSAVAHRLLAECLEKLNRPQSALASYRRSLELDPLQKELLLKVCELMSHQQVSLDPQCAKYWCEQAQQHYPNHPTLFTLREKILAANIEENGDAVEKLILNELEQCPTDCGLRIRLLQHFLQNNKISDGYKHAFDIEKLKYNIFSDNITWYKTVAELINRFQRDNNSTSLLNVDFWIFATIIWDKLVTLSLDEQQVEPIGACISNVFNFDQTLYLAEKNIQQISERNFVQEFLNHFQGQLCLHVVTLLLKKAKMGNLDFKDASRNSIPLLLAAWQASPSDPKADWVNQTSETNRKWIQRWFLEGNFRVSQAGHILLGILGDKRSNLSDKIAQICSGNWRERLYRIVFLNREHIANIKTSALKTCSLLNDVRSTIPTTTELHTYDKKALLLHPSSLHHMIWVAMNTRHLYQVQCLAFSGLQYSVNNLNNCAVETLNLLDIETFVYCTVLCAKSRLNSQANLKNGEPKILPVSLTEQLCTTVQNSWYKAVDKVYQNQCGGAKDLGSLRLILTHGIETVRCVGNHGIHVILLVQLAKSFEERAKSTKDPTHKEFTAARAKLFWTSAIPLLERVKSGQNITYGSTNKNPIFNYSTKDNLTTTEINNYLEDGKLFLACQLKEERAYERALSYLQDLKSPYASFYEAQIYKSMADDQIGSDRENVTSEMRSQRIIMLSKARDSFYETFYRLQKPSVDQNHPLNLMLGTEIENIESLLAQIDPDMYHMQNEYDNVSEESISSSVESMGDHIQMNASSALNNRANYPGVYNNNNSHQRHNRSRNVHHSSTPFRNNVNVETDSLIRRAEARPSPERLEAQIRQMAATKDATYTHIINQIYNISSEIHSLKDSVNSLSKEFKDTLKSFTEQTRDDLNFIKKEMSELKKEKSKGGQLNDDDLYVLDDDYDYNSINAAALAAAATSTSFTPQNSLYQGCNLSRTPQAAAPYGYTPPLYPSLYPPMYGLPGLPHPANAQLPFFQPTEADYRNISAALVHQQIASTPIPPNPLGAGLGMFSKPITIPDTTVTYTKSMITPPANVVITTPDPVPTTSVVNPTLLSVTIPPQHIKGSNQAHNYQIPLPTTTFTSSLNYNQSTPLPITTHSLLSNVASPVYSAIPTPPGQKPSLFGTKTGENMFSSTSTSTLTKPLPATQEANTSLNENVSSSSIEEHDPYPDFKPIIPLPNEVQVCTGEENEEVLYKDHAKLYRFVDKEWKERGIGDIKLLKNSSNGKIRLLMRRDQIHKICANHYLTRDMELQRMSTSDRAFIWAANDFSDEEIRLEKLCVRFKTPEQAEKFRVEFEKAKCLVTTVVSPIKDGSSMVTTSESKQSQSLSTPVSSTSSTFGSSNTLGGFTFSSTPTFKPKTEKTEIEQPKVTTAAPSPFASFSFSSSSLKTTASPFDIKNITPIQKSPVVEFKPIDQKKEITTSKNVDANVGKSEETSSSWGSKFRPKSGSWTCTDCYIVNAEDANNCVACNALNPSAPKPVTSIETTTSGSSWGGQFKPKEGSWNCSVCYVNNDGVNNKCVACETHKDGTSSTTTTLKGGITLTPTTKFSFGIPPVTTSSSGFSFSAFNFGTSTCTTPTNDSKPTGFTFGVSQTTTDTPTKSLNLADFGKSNTGFQFSKPMPTIPSLTNTSSNDTSKFESSPRTPRQSGGGDESDGDHTLEDEGEHIYFTPIVPLPDKIEVKTGEEGEEVLYVHRAKLLRFVSSEWKERGLGDVKILRNPSTGKLRVVMRREQVLKICLNHALTDAVDYILKDEKSWLFGAHDFSEGELVYQQFCIRFKTPEIAQEFKEAIDNARAGRNAGGDQLSLPAQKDKVDESDVVFVSEQHATKEEQERAKALMLPTDFYLYLKKPPCPGCIGCNSDDYVFKSTTKSAPTSKNEILKTPETTKPQFSFSNAFNSLGLSTTPTSTRTSIFGGAADNSPSTPSSIFAPPKISSDKTNVMNIFGGKSTTQPAAEAISIFGKQSTPSETTSIFGGNKSIPSTKDVSLTTDKPSLFSSSTMASSTFDKAPIGSQNTGQTVAFGSSIFGKSDFSKSVTSPFTATPDSGLFSATPVFGASTLSQSTEPATEAATPKSKSSETTGLLFQNAGDDFSTLAKKTSDNFLWGTNPQGSSFKFENTGAPVFGSASKNTSKSTPKKHDETVDDEGDGDEDDANEHDPHYEPIVPLPDKIDVKTGEEDETVKFCQRGKLFRYDSTTAEWKERGVGDMKILFHPIKHTYRFLLRREQVHKLVLNQLITEFITLGRLNSSDCAFLWAGENYAEDTPVVEKLAVRFKSPDIAMEFWNAVTEAQNMLRERRMNSLQADEKEDDDEDEDKEKEDDSEYEENCDYVGEEYDEDQSITYEKHCELSTFEDGAYKSLGSGDIQVCYDSHMYCMRIKMLNEAGDVIANNIIENNTIMTKEDLSCVWTAIDDNLEKERTLRATFENEADANDFYIAYQEGVASALVEEQ